MCTVYKVYELYVRNVCEIIKNIYIQNETLWFFSNMLHIYIFDYIDVQKKHTKKNQYSNLLHFHTHTTYSAHNRHNLLYNSLTQRPIQSRQQPPSNTQGSITSTPLSLLGESS